MNKIKIFRLTTGDDVIAEVIPNPKKRSRNILLKDPMRILIEFDPKTKHHHTFLIRWIPHSSDRIFSLAPNRLVIPPFNPLIELEDHYYDVCDDTWEPDDPTDPDFVARQERRLQLKLELERPTRDEDIN